MPLVAWRDGSPAARLPEREAATPTISDRERPSEPIQHLRREERVRADAAAVAAVALPHALER